jgi:hypothetical protein
MSYVLAHTAALGLLAGAFWLPGYAFERALLRARDLGGLRSLTRVCSGLAFWMAGTFLLAATGQLAPVPVGGLMVISAMAAAGARWRWGAAPREALALVSLPLLLVALSPHAPWDAATYHLALPKQFVAAGGFRPVPMSIYSNWPLGTELLFAVAMLVQDHVLAKLLHLGFGLLTLHAVFLACREFHRPASGWLAAPLLLANPVVLFEMTAAYVDLAYAFFLLSALLFMARALGGGRDANTCLLLAGLCAGVLTGLKLNGFVGAAAIGALSLPTLLTAARRGEARPAMRDLSLRFALPVLLLWLPWLIKSAAYTGDPFYPFLYPLLGGPDWSPALADQLRTWQRSIGMGREALDYLLLPARVILAGGVGYGHFAGQIGAFWIALLPLALLFGLGRRLVRCCLGASAVYFAAWSLSSQQMRLLIPILPLLSIASAVTVLDLLERLPSARVARAARCGLPVAAAVVAIVLGRGAFHRGLEMLPLYWSSAPSLQRAVVHPVYAFIDRELPEDARLLLLNTNQGFFIERDYLADSFFEASQIADWLRPASTVGEVRQRLESRGITHVLIEHRSWGIRYPDALLALLRDPAQVEPRYRPRNGRFTLLELR